MPQKVDKRPAGKNADAIGAATTFVAEFGAPVPPPKLSKPSLAALAQVSVPSSSMTNDDSKITLGMHHWGYEAHHTLDDCQLCMPMGGDKQQFLITKDITKNKTKYPLPSALRTFVAFPTSRPRSCGHTTVLRE